MLACAILPTRHRVRGIYLRNYNARLWDTTNPPPCKGHISSPLQCSLVGYYQPATVEEPVPSGLRSYPPHSANDRLHSRPGRRPTDHCICQYNLEEQDVNRRPATHQQTAPREVLMLRDKEERPVVRPRRQQRATSEIRRKNERSLKVTTSDAVLHRKLLYFIRKRTMQLRAQGQEARERYGRHSSASSLLHGVQCFRPNTLLRVFTMGPHRGAVLHVNAATAAIRHSLFLANTHSHLNTMCGSHPRFWHDKKNHTWRYKMATVYLPQNLCKTIATGGAVTERLALSPATKANRVQSPAGSPDFCTWESCTMPLVGGFPRGSPVSPALSFRRCSMLTSITLINRTIGSALHSPARTGDGALVARGRVDLTTRALLGLQRGEQLQVGGRRLKDRKTAERKNSELVWCSELIFCVDLGSDLGPSFERRWYNRAEVLYSQVYCSNESLSAPVLTEPWCNGHGYPTGENCYGFSADNCPAKRLLSPPLNALLVVASLSSHTCRALRERVRYLPADDGMRRHQRSFRASMVVILARHSFNTNICVFTLPSRHNHDALVDDRRVVRRRSVLAFLCGRRPIAVVRMTRHNCDGVMSKNHDPAAGASLCFAQSSALFRMLYARGMHGACPQDAPMAMSQYSLHVKSVASLELLGSALSLSLLLYVLRRHTDCSVATSPRPYQIGIPLGNYKKKAALLTLRRRRAPPPQGPPSPPRTEISELVNPAVWAGTGSDN
ncbi:hypothetical protein PR048_032611 [Dryococelus australis]|uniref:Uncharacterized protein n=1 Tax=Dryococelus australis TaxID=614101 RepID=A0ABQ9G2P7_9NEOP|nr:hypothetical protein PR048_032611 [Dryococelus australis]